MTRIAFTNVRIFDGTGEDTYTGDVLVEGKRIVEVARAPNRVSTDDARVIGGRGRGWVRMALGIIGPSLVLAAALLMATYGMPTEWLLYPGLVIMIVIAIWDLKAKNAAMRT